MLSVDSTTTAISHSKRYCHTRETEENEMFAFGHHDAYVEFW